jgi:hypothetical protein
MDYLTILRRRFLVEPVAVGSSVGDEKNSVLSLVATTISSWVASFSAIMLQKLVQKK